MKLWRQTQINLISGSPGSGKTSLAESISGYVLVDDPKTKPTFEPEVNYLITDPKLCYRGVFDTVNQLYPEAHWIFFRPNALQCWINVQKRLEKEPNKVIGYHSFVRFASEYEANFKYYLESVNTFQIVEVFNGLV